MADIKNVVILGDSMSDIGNKWLWPMGQLGRLFGAMRVNETGRFSDGKNWTDFLIEWSTGESLMWGNREVTIRKSTDYRTLSRSSVLSVNTWDRPLETKPPEDLDAYLTALLKANKQKATTTPPQITYVNYSMGGCIVTRDWTPKFGALTYLSGQVENYIAQRSYMDKPLAGATMHIIWIGLNDFVTAKRPDYDSDKVKTLPSTNDYAAWKTWSKTHPGDSTNGVGVFPAVAEIQSLVESINSRFSTAKADNYFMVIDLPSVYNAIRYIEGLGEPTKVAEAKSIDPIMQRYNEMLESLVQNWPAGDPTNAPAPDHVHLVQMSRWMDYVSENLDTWQLSKKAQKHGVQPFYNPAIPPAPTEDPESSETRRGITTSDLGHPTEAVYSIMARYFVTKLLQNGHTLGRLTSNTWRQNAPFNALPFNVK
jgi:phospholipase/lecithinase/hemolysin